MSPREKNLVIILVVTLVLGVVVGGGYFGFYQPWSEKIDQAEKLAAENQKKESDLNALIAKDKVIRSTLSRGLPADPDIARQEYDAVLYKMLRDAKVPANSLSIKPKAVDSKTGIPEIADKKPAFQKIAFEVNLDKVSYGMILDVLYRYYNLNILHQITKLTIRKEQTTNSGIRMSPSLSDKADLSVTLVTEAIILDGAESRPTLYPVPPGMAALSGGAGLQAIMATPSVGRELRPLQVASALAYADRSYNLMLVKDIFHGMPPPPPKPRKDPDPEPEPEKEDTSPYIRLTGLGRNADGTGSAVIEDVAAKFEYTISLKMDEGKLVPETSKVYFLKGVRKKEYMECPPGSLLISDESSRTTKLFKVLGFFEDQLILQGSEGGVVPKSSTPTKAPGGGSTRPAFVRAPPTSAAIGAVVVAVPQSRVYAWKHGDPLNKIKELTKEEGVKMLEKFGISEKKPASKGL